MNDENPYSTPTAIQRESDFCERPSTRRLWIAYAIAPIVAPTAAAVVVFIIAFVYQTTHTEDIDVNPLSMILGPVLLLILGVPASYSVVGLIGMPIAFALRKRNRLNGYTVHGAALLWTALLALGLPVAALLISWSGNAEAISVIQFLGVILGLFVAFAPFVLLSATTFWLIGIQPWKRKPVADASCYSESSAA